MCMYALLGTSSARAVDFIYNYIPEAKLVGQGRAQIMLWDVYDAKLYASDGVYAQSKPFALELEYLQELKGRKIADHAVSEMRRLGYKNEVKLAVWHDRMNRIFPDVMPGSVITGIYIPEGPSIFYKDGKEAGRVEDPAFGKQFFSIWLDARTSTPSLRQRLLNMDGTMKGHKNEMPANFGNFGDGHAS